MLDFVEESASLGRREGRIIACRRVGGKQAEKRREWNGSVGKRSVCCGTLDYAGGEMESHIQDQACQLLISRSRHCTREVSSSCLGRLAE